MLEVIGMYGLILQDGGAGCMPMSARIFADI